MTTLTTGTQRHREQKDQKTSAIIGAAIEVHRQLGPGLLESVYEDCLCYELRLRGIPFQRQVPLPLVYKGLTLESSYRLDIVAEDRIVIEVKAVEQLLRVHEAQLLSYLCLSGKHVGLLINFHVPYLYEGIKRLVL